MWIQISLLTIALASFFLVSPSLALSHEGHDHPEETPVASQTSEMENVQSTTATLAEATHTTPLWIPVTAVLAGIIVGIIGIYFLHTKILHPKTE